MKTITYNEDTQVVVDKYALSQLIAEVTDENMDISVERAIQFLYVDVPEQPVSVDKPRWIACSEQMPPHTKPVTAKWKDGYCDIVYRCGKNFFFLGGDKIDIDPPDFWLEFDIPPVPTDQLLKEGE